LKLISPDRRGGKVPFPEVCPLCPHPTFRAMGGHSIHFAEYVNRIRREKKRQGKNGIRKAQNLKSRSSEKRTAGRKNGGESGI
jgi:hypothetical protein